MIATFNLEERTLQRRTIRLDRGIIDAVLVSPDRCFFTTPGDRDVVMLSGDLMTCAPKIVTSPWSYGLCHWKERSLILLTQKWEDDDRDRVEILVLDYDGKLRLWLTSLFAPFFGKHILLVFRYADCELCCCRVRCSLLGLCVSTPILKSDRSYTCWVIFLYLIVCKFPK